MTGHIRRRGVQTFEIKYDVERAGSRRRTVYRSFKGTRKQAEAELTRLLAQVADGGHVDPSRLTVGEHVTTRFSHWKASGAISLKTSERYEELIVGQILPFIGDKPLQKLSTQDIELWHSTLLTKGRRGRNGKPDGESGVSRRTISHVHRILRKAIGEAQKHGLVVRNVCAIERAPRITPKEMTILTAAQVAELPAQLHGHPMEAAALVALFCGLRRGEILALRWKHVIDDKETISVRESLEETRAGLRFKQPKSESGRRDVRLPAIVTDALEQHRKRLLERRLMLGQGKLTGEDLVFPAWDGSPQRPNSFGSTWSKLAKQLGLKVSFHALRHSHVSQLIDHGVDVVTIARRLGHSSPAITLQTYAHLFQQDDGKAAAAINASLGGRE